MPTPDGTAQTELGPPPGTVDKPFGGTRSDSGCGKPEGGAPAPHTGTRTFIPDDDEPEK